MESAAVITEISAAEFEQRVVAASHERPVVVDFWAPWCGPCHQLSPVLERVATRYADDVDIVKLNVDTAPQISQRYRIQSIPAVKGFRNGAVAAEFVGVQPEPAIDELFSALLPTEADRLVAQAQGRDPSAAEPLLRRALEVDRAHPGAVLALAHIELEAGRADDARALLQRVPSDPQARRLLAQLDLVGDDDTDVAALAAAAEAGDAAAQLRLGRSLAVQGRHGDALPLLVAAVSDPASREEARAAVVAVFEVLGADDELVRRWRPKLTAALF